MILNLAIFLRYDIKSTSNERENKMDKWDFIKIWNICPIKEYYQGKKKDNPQSRKFAKHILDELVSRI